MMKGADGTFPEGFTPEYVADDVPALPVPAVDCTFSVVVRAFNMMVADAMGYGDTVNILDFLLFWMDFRKKVDVDDDVDAAPDVAPPAGLLCRMLRDHPRVIAAASQAGSDAGGGGVSSGAEVFVVGSTLGRWKLVLNRAWRKKEKDEAEFYRTYWYHLDTKEALWGEDYDIERMQTEAKGKQSLD